MHYHIPDSVPNFVNTPKHSNSSLACKDQLQLQTKEQDIHHLLKDIYAQYESDPRYLRLHGGRTVLLKSTFVKVIRTAKNYFENPDNQNRFCQIHIQSHTFDLVWKSFCIDRDLKIWMYDITKAIARTHNNVIHKILNVRTGKLAILKRLPSVLSFALGENAENYIRDRFNIINDLYHDVQPCKIISLQPPPFAIVDVHLSRDNSTVGLIEEYFPAGDFYGFANSPEYAQISLLARAKFCLEYANNIQFLNRLDIYHPDIKTENILIKELPLGGYQLFISDYSDSVRLYAFFDLFEKILAKPNIPSEDVKFLKSLNYMHTNSCCLKNDVYHITRLLKLGILDIAKKAGNDLENRSKLFKEYKKTLVNLVRKHQVFTLGISFYQMLSGPHFPYLENQELVNLYCGEGVKQLHSNAKETLIEQMLLLSPRAQPVIEEMANFVMKMIETDHHDRPSLSIVCKKWKEFSTHLDYLSSPKQRAMSQHPDSPPQIGKTSPRPTILEMLTKQPLYV